MHHTHSALFVGLSVLVAAAGSWTALDLFRRVRNHVGRARATWLITAAVAMGASIWSMHFIAMLGFDPGSPVGYDPGLTLLSFVLAVLATAVAFFLVQRGGGHTAPLLGAGLVMGFGICLMHYVGMAAMRTAMSVGYDPGLVVLSFVVAVAASTAALFMARREDSAARRALAAVILGAAISGMHYTAMAALRLGPMVAVNAVRGAPPDLLALALTLSCMSLLALALMASLYDQRVNVMTALEGGRIGYWEAVGPPMSLQLSDRAKIMLGFGAAESVSYDRLLAALGDTCRKELDADIRRALAEGTAFSRECRMGDGWIDVRARAVARGGGSRRLSGVILDITDLVQGRRALQDSEARLNLAISAARLGVWEWRLDTNEMLYSERAKEICGFPAGEPVTYEMVAAVTHPDDFPFTSAQAKRALDPDIRDNSPYEYRLRLPDGRETWVYAEGQAVFETAADGSERAIRYVGVLEDITERKRAEEELRASEDRLRLAIEAGQMAVWTANEKGEVELTPELLRVLGFPSDAPTTREEARAGYLPGERERIHAEADAALARGEQFFEVEFQYRPPGGEPRWLMTRSEIRLDASGRPTGAIGVVMDVTERRRAQERLQLLAREVDHRANNLLTVVQGVIALSQGEDASTLKETITGRVQALAQAHKLLSSTRWEGADLVSLVREELLPYELGESGRVVILGEPVTLSPAEAQAAAMLLHELATNAAKYGALSVPSGRVSITWAVQADGFLDLTWSETGGPRAAKPKRRGFGLTIIDRALSSLPGSESRISWRPQGVVCEIRINRGGQAPAPTKARGRTKRQAEALAES